MRGARFILLFFACAGSLAYASLVGCGGALDPGANIVIAVAPTKSYLLPGSGASCTDYYTASTTGLVVTDSVSQFRLVFPVFSLQWTSLDLLYVAYIKFNIINSNISGGAFEQVLTDTDLGPILGITSGSAFNGALYPTFISTIKTISTSAPRTSASPPATYPACSFMVGGIGLTNPKIAFSGQGTITLVGYSLKADLTQSPVKTQIPVTFQYIP